MKKLLHERLRECKGAFSTLAMMGFDPDDSFSYEGLFQMMADEIERYYIPRPRFEDGEPVQFGDDYEQKSAGYISSIAGITVYNDGSYSIHDSHGNGTYTPGDFPAKRPQPKVLDADGIEIKVGDTVWCIDSGEKYTVERTFNGEPRVLLSDTKIGTFGSYALNRLTHKEPDSLEKLRDDMEKFNAYLNTHDQSNCEVNTFADRLSALIERGA